MPNLKAIDTNETVEKFLSKIGVRKHTWIGKYQMGIAINSPDADSPSIWDILFTIMRESKKGFELVYDEDGKNKDA